MKRKSKQPQEPAFHVEDGSLSLACIHIDALLDRIQNNKLKSFDPSVLEQLRKLSQKEIKDLNNQYSHTVDDITAALSGDDFFLEAYSNYDKAQMKIIQELFKKLKKLKHDDNASGKIRVAQGPRKKKSKPPEEVVKKVLYLAKDTETGVSSLNPVVLVGALELWVYNTKTRKLGCYYAKTDAGLTAKGTTILNYDEKKSTTKTIRKPIIQIKEFLSKSPTNMFKYWDAIRAVPQPISPRLSRETLILRATGNEE